MQRGESMTIINISSSTMQDLKKLLNDQKISSTILRITSRIG